MVTTIAACMYIALAVIVLGWMLWASITRIKPPPTGSVARQRWEAWNYDRPSRSEPK